MSYAEAFAEAMAGKGVPVDASVVPDQEAVNSDLDALRAWLSSLDEGTRAALDLVTAKKPIKAGLADQSVGIVQTIGPLLAAFDSQPAPISISTALEMLTDASAKAAVNANDA
jgi:hypothetical protein